MRLLLLAALVPMVLGSGAGVATGPPGQWTRVTAPNGSNTDLVGVARTGDGVLHVAWLRHEADNRSGIWHSAISPSGASVGEANAIATGWLGVNHPDLIRTADGGLRAFFGGLRGTGPSDPNVSLNTAAAPATGSSWSLQTGSVTPTTTVYARSVGAGLARDGTPVVAWDGNRGEAAYHFGLEPSGPEARYVQGLSSETCGCPVLPDIAVDSVSGDVQLGWSSLITGLPGVYVQTITPSGPGQALRAPGSAEFDLQRVGITARIDAPGVYVGYTGGSPRTSVRLWRVGTTAPALSIGARNARYVTATAGPGGRVWLLWMRDNRLFFTRTNKEATEHGDIVSLAPPEGTSAIWQLTGEGSLGPLDVLAHVSTPGSTATWHTRVLPPLELAVTSVPAAGHGGRGSGGAKATVTARVTDAGDPVAGVVVRLAGQSKRTNARGVARFQIGQGGSYRATASKSGYGKDQAKVRIRQKKKR